MKRSVYLFVCVFFLFASCEYQLGENYLEVEKVRTDLVADHVEVYGSFIHNMENDAFEMEHSVKAAFHVYPLPGLKVEKLVVRLGEMMWESHEERCDFMLDVDRIPNGSYELSCEIYAWTNNGTVAGQVGAEQYMEKRSWPLRVNARTESDHLLEWRMTEEGYPEIGWEVDESLRSGFAYYTVEYQHDHSTYIRRITDFDQRSFVDKEYAVGAGGTYRVYIYFKDEAVRPYSLGKAVLDTDGLSNLKNGLEK